MLAPMVSPIDRDLEQRALESWHRQWTQRHRRPLRIRPAAAPPLEQRDYRGFLSWCVLLVPPGREKRSAEALLRANAPPYWPHFWRSIYRGGRRRRIEQPVLPGKLFMPIELLDVDNRDALLDWAGVSDLLKRDAWLMLLSKADIENIRRIEARLNAPDRPVDCHGTQIGKGAAVRFIDPLNVRLFGDGIVFEVARDKRIGVEVNGLFGGLTKVYVAAGEIELI